MKLSKLRMSCRSQIEIDARAKYDEAWNVALSMWGERIKEAGFEKPSFRFFDHKSSTAGLAFYNYNVVAINAPLLALERENLINRTINHELAHHIAFRLFDCRGHGSMWRIIWAKLGGTNITRCHSFDVSSIKKTKTVQYKLIDNRTGKLVRNYYRKPKISLGLTTLRLKSDPYSYGHLVLRKV